VSRSLLRRNCSDRVGAKPNGHEPIASGSPQCRRNAHGSTQDGVGRASAPASPGWRSQSRVLLGVGEEVVRVASGDTPLYGRRLSCAITAADSTWPMCSIDAIHLALRSGRLLRLLAYTRLLPAAISVGLSVHSPSGLSCVRRAAQAPCAGMVPGAECRSQSYLDSRGVGDFAGGKATQKACRLSVELEPASARDLSGRDVRPDGGGRLVPWRVAGPSERCCSVSSFRRRYDGRCPVTGVTSAAIPVVAG
jgi:hypothetical protein